jgi:predicted 3-demethylubiquinone-9 3-methyltransferase (glyoxalase superfamily)
MQKINPFLWFNDQAEEAANFYVSIFENSKLLDIRKYGDAGPVPKGSVMLALFQLDGVEFYALNGGPQFSVNPSVSFFVNCETEQQIDTLWAKLSENGKALMPLDEYPFSKRYGWIQDKFNVSWQLNLTGTPQKISPFLMYVGDQNGRAEEAIHFYVSLFPNSHVDRIIHFPGNEGGEKKETVMNAAFTLNGQEFIAMDGGMNHAFTFTWGASFFINCDTQEEVDYFWEKLSEGGKEEQCGWLKDKFGLSWQVIPTALMRLRGDKDPVRAQRVFQAMLQMSKIDIATLEKAYEGK